MKTEVERGRKIRANIRNERLKVIGIVRKEEKGNQIISVKDHELVGSEDED
jgi:hypothetical protein